MRAKLYTLLSSLHVRMALILLGGLMAAQSASLWLQWDERAAVVSEARRLNFPKRIAEVIRVLESVDAAARDAALSALQSEELSVSIIQADQVSQSAPRGMLSAMVASHLGSERIIRHVAATPSLPQRDSPQRKFDVRLRDGQWVRIVAGPATDAPVPALPVNLIVQLMITFGVVVAVVMIAGRQATRPVQQLAQAADTLGRDLDAHPLIETGPAETRLAAQAFNRMQARIKHLVNERAKVLAAVSHDLRTPLTRLRLRAELVDDSQLRDQMAGDLESMAAMLDATLDYLRGLRDSEEVRPIDINALLESMVEDARVVGRIIGIEGRALTPYRGRLSALHRALQNLIDNAIKYGHGAHIRIEDCTAHLSIHVEDNGPGIESAELPHVTEPYYRVGATRSFEVGGVGLGLSIARDVALLHSGELHLANRAQGGLAATLWLPRA